ncbi:DUF4282 domain-containing protein [bacterium]|nr:DUF4282 domain-containing protein [candidate division CSSED10-310 bacterium]
MFRFSEFITIKLIKFLYILGMIISLVAAIGIIIAGFGNSMPAGIVFLILSPIVFVIAENTGIRISFSRSLKS